MERQRIAQETKAIWESFETAIGADDLGEAAAVLAQVRDLNPEEPGLAAAEQRLAELAAQRTAQALESQWASFEAALVAADFEVAANALDGIRALDPDAPELAAGEQRLEATRQAAELKELAGEMVSIPGGMFRMGDLSGEGDEDEKPVHSVTVPAFRLGRHEVTVDQFRRFVEATGYRTDAERNADGNAGCSVYTGDGFNWTAGHSWRNPVFPVGDTHPVVCVSWNDAEAFVKWLSAQTGKAFRLPTEAEWEYAARAGSTTKYHFGDSWSQLCRYANHADTSTDFDWRNESCSDGAGYHTEWVGSYQPNSFGLYDMHGNAWEWVQDCWNNSYAGAPTDGRAWTLGDCSLRVIRGGSWDNFPGHLRSAVRYRPSRSYRGGTLGFRLAQDK